MLTPTRALAAFLVLLLIIITVRCLCAPPEYIPASSFAGRRSGYVFAMRDGKLGYWVDNKKNGAQE